MASHTHGYLSTIWQQQQASFDLVELQLSGIVLHQN